MDRAGRRQQLLHPVEVSILDSLRRGRIVRFADLMRPTGLTSDSFKFYIRRLVACEWIEKLPDGYRLTPSGKEFANNVDDGTRTLQKQPKLSVVIIAKRINRGNVEYLFQRRQRQPFYGRWGLLSGPVVWGEAIEQAAGRELHKQTGLSATCTVASFARVMDHAPKGELLEDKLFAIVVVAPSTSVLENSWGGGHNEWLSLEALEAKADYFSLTRPMLELAASGQPYATFAPQYDQTDY